MKNLFQFLLIVFFNGYSFVVMAETKSIIGASYLSSSGSINQEEQGLSVTARSTSESNYNFSATYNKLLKYSSWNSALEGEFIFSFISKTSLSVAYQSIIETGLVTHLPSRTVKIRSDTSVSNFGSLSYGINNLEYLNSRVLIFNASIAIEQLQNKIITPKIFISRANNLVNSTSQDGVAGALGYSMQIDSDHQLISAISYGEESNLEVSGARLDAVSSISLGIKKDINQVHTIKAEATYENRPSSGAYKTTLLFSYEVTAW